MLMKVLWRLQRLPGCSENSYTVSEFMAPLYPPTSLSHPLKFKEEKGEREREKEEKHPNFNINTMLPPWDVTAELSVSRTLIKER